MVPNCLRLPLEDGKIDNKLSIRQVSFAIIRGNLLLAKKCICTINEKVPVLKIKLRCTNYTNTFECILFEQISDHYLHSPGITVWQIFVPWIFVRKLYIVSHVIGVLEPVFRCVSICFDLSQPGWVICRIAWKMKYIGSMERTWSLLLDWHLLCILWLAKVSLSKNLGSVMLG